MPEVLVMVKSGDITLEGLFAKGNGKAAAVLCHPHPLYGGAMDNGVVVTMQKVLNQMGWATLRFNFRGVGNSGGSYDDGAGEAEDVRAVMSHLHEQDFDEYHLGGYSFGAWVGLRAVEAHSNPASMILISPPVDFLEFGSLKLPPCPCLVTAGDRDDFCSVGSLRNWLSQQPANTGPAELHILPNCDHFYWGSEPALSVKIADFLRKYF